MSDCIVPKSGAIRQNENGLHLLEAALPENAFKNNDRRLIPTDIP
jgi:hypothetical protein